MSVEAGRVACLLLEESFGKIVGRVGSYLIARGEQSLPNILKGVDLDKEQVVAAAAVYSLATFALLENKLISGVFEHSVFICIKFKLWKMYIGRTNHKFPTYTCGKNT